MPSFLQFKDCRFVRNQTNLFLLLPLTGLGVVDCCTKVVVEIRNSRLDLDDVSLDISVVGGWSVAPSAAPAAGAAVVVDVDEPRPLSDVCCLSCSVVSAGVDESPGFEVTASDFISTDEGLDVPIVEVTVADSSSTALRPSGASFGTCGVKGRKNEEEEEVLMGVLVKRTSETGIVSWGAWVVLDTGWVDIRAAAIDPDVASLALKAVVTAEEAVDA